jgi:hypothetical protein
VTPGDRRLPLVYLSHRIGNLATLPFDELAATAGVGPKKLEALVRLMERALVHGPGGSNVDSAARTGADTSIGQGPIDVLSISELQWAQYRESARRLDLGNTCLGRLAGSLQDLPSVLWQARLSTYLDASLSDIRQLRTYGEKRVRAVLQIFHDIDRAVGRSEIPSHLDIEMGPKRMRAVERYLEDIERLGIQPAEQEFRERVAAPLLEQLRIDLGEVVFSLICERFGLNGPAQSVRSQSLKWNLTRARIYQVMDSCARAMEVRWPEGRRLLESLIDSLPRYRQKEGGFMMLVGLRDLCFPRKFAEPSGGLLSSPQPVSY